MYNYPQWSLSLIVHVYYQTTAELADLRKSLKLANNQIEETRRKYLQSQEEQKKMKAILAKEIGDGDSDSDSVMVTDDEASSSRRRQTWLVLVLVMTNLPTYLPTYLDYLPGLLY